MNPTTPNPASNPAVAAGFPARGPLQPGSLSPRRPVPENIPAPDYVGLSAPPPYRGPHRYDAEEIERIREAGRLAAQAIDLVEEQLRPGMTTDDLDRIAHSFLLAEGAYPSCLGYRGFPKSICTSVNEVICHGIPDSTVLQEGDLVNVDITAYRKGMHGDTNRSLLVGGCSQPEVELLVERTRDALRRAIAVVKPGRPLNVIGLTIEKYASRFGYGVVRDYTGHGVGRAFHTGLIIPHYDAAPNYAQPLEQGMVFTIEPMLNLGSESWNLWDDGWTVVTSDGKISAQFEHTLVVTADGADILTLSTRHPA